MELAGRLASYSPTMRQVLALFVVALSSLALAKPDFLVAFQDHYKPTQGSPADLAQCRNCHTDPPNRNDYGKAVKQVLTELNKDTPDASVFAAVEKMSSGDGKTFGSQMATRLGHEVEGAATTSKPAESPKSPELIPAHSFHPTIVHFPIALFMFGAFLDIWGKMRRSDKVRSAAFPCLLGGALAGIPSVALGITAAIRLGYGLTGKAETHMLFALAATGCMLGVAASRRKGALDSPGYWVALVVGTALVGLAGHLGGTLVFG